MESGSVGPAWRKLFELLSDVCRQEDADSMLSAVAEHIEEVVPIDHGLAFNELHGDIPYCTRWPDYADSLVPQFNTYFNSRCPVAYNWKHHLLGPIEWRQYEDTEYDAEFNRPMSLGHSLGIGFPDPLVDCERVLVIHRARGSTPFSEKDTHSLLLLRPLLERIYGMSRENEKLWREHFNPEELEPDVRTLSPREAEVARLLMHRIPMREIGRRLEISPRTVERHALHIYQKLHVSGRRELARVLSRKGSSQKGSPGVGSPRTD